MGNRSAVRRLTVFLPITDELLEDTEAWKRAIRERAAFVASVRAALRERGRDTVTTLARSLKADRRRVQIVLDDMVQFGQATRARSDIHRGRLYFYQLMPGLADKPPVRTILDEIAGVP